MNQVASADRLQGQLIALNVLVEALLKQQPKEAIRAIAESLGPLGRETGDILLNTQGSEAMLDGYREAVAQHEGRVRELWQQAIFRESAQPRHPSR